MPLILQRFPDGTANALSGGVKSWEANMKSLVILGAGTAGTIMANKLSKTLDPSEWKLTIVDGHPIHYYQPGFLFIPFDVYQPAEVKRPKADFLPVGVNFVQAEVDVIEPDKKRVRLADQGTYLSYDVLIIATGTESMTTRGTRNQYQCFFTCETPFMADSYTTG